MGRSRQELCIAEWTGFRPSEVGVEDAWERLGRWDG
jgi:hypothetical protein